AALALVLLLRYPLGVALGVAVALGQIGEFSFILAILGNQLGILPEAATQVIVAAAIISITLNPLLYRLVDPVEGGGAPAPRLWGWLNAGARARLPDGPAPAPGGPRPPSPRHRAVIVGYGPVGRTVARLLRENEVEPTVIELNLDTVRALREEGVRAVYGDSRPPA